MYTSVLIICVAVATVLEALSIDQRIMNAAPKPSGMDMFHMSPNGEVKMMVELDILMDLDQYMQFKGTPLVGRNRRGKRKAVRSLDTRWTNCYVYYEISNTDFDADDKAVIREAMEEWQKYTCLQFKIATSSTKDKIVFQRGSGGCYSNLGRRGGTQEIGLSKGCVHRGVIVHEIGHAIGWIHEQARPDRDRFIRVNFNKIPTNWHPQFDKFDGRLINDYGVRYDYRSIMHYSGDAVAPMSIETLDPKYQKVIGQREGLSFRDVMLANLMYQCANMICPGENTDCSRYGRDAFLFKPDGDQGCRCFCPGNSEDEVMMPCDDSKHTTSPAPRTTTPTPTTPTPRPLETTTTPEPEPECRDLRDDCPQLKLDGECKMDMERMFVFCKRSCNFCEKENMCMDYDPTCPLLALGDFCDHPDFRPIMQKNCKKSCKFCTPVDPCQMQIEMGLSFEGSGTQHLRPCSGLGILVLVWVVHRIFLFKLF